MNAPADWICAAVRVALAMVLSSLLALGAVSAQPDSQPIEQDAWHDGVTERAKARARERFERAVDLHEQLRFTEAEAQYRSALDHWDHPQIRFYYSRALMKLGRLLDAYAHLRRAQRWGPDALSAEETALATDMIAELESALARVEIRCDEPDAQVQLNGETVVLERGQADKMVRPGPYVITANKPGFHSVTHTLSVFAGERARATVTLKVDAGVHLYRRWSAWKPWAVAGAGVVAALVGAVMETEARGAYREFDDELARFCGTDAECRPGTDPTFTRILDRGDRARNLSVGAFVVGGSLIAVGIAMIALNPPRLRRGETSRIQIAPTVSRGAVHLSGQIRF